MNRSGFTLRKLIDWSVLTTYDTSTIALVTSTQTYALPSDFDRLVPDTFWDNTDDRQVFGSRTPRHWASAKGRGVVPIVHKRFRIAGTNVEFLDDVTAGDNGNVIAFFYVSKNWAANASATPQASMTSDTDTARIDETLIETDVVWRVRRSLGLPWETYFTEFTNLMSNFAGHDATPGEVDMGAGRPLDLDDPRLNVPEGTFPSA